MQVARDAGAFFLLHILELGIEMLVAFGQRRQLAGHVIETAGQGGEFRHPALRQAGVIAAAGDGEQTGLEAAEETQSVADRKRQNDELARQNSAMMVKASRTWLQTPAISLAGSLVKTTTQGYLASAIGMRADSGAGAIRLANHAGRGRVELRARSWTETMVFSRLVHQGGAHMALAFESSPPPGAG